MIVCIYDAYILAMKKFPCVFWRLEVFMLKKTGLTMLIVA